ncbi:MAG: acylphosphatase [Hyphomicrobiaceae bacterium]|nr:acylphosphatase [Hyphomicrobiaceae bacterium]
MGAEKTVHVMVAGRVQGVGYRAWVEREALALGLSGWVRNRRSGEVEAVFAGKAGAVDAMVGYCSRGPTASDVSEVRVLATGAPVPMGFKIIASE